MPFIQCDLAQTLTDAQKEQLIGRIAQATHDAIGSPYRDINIVVRQHPPSSLHEGCAEKRDGL
jgi:phenylpyruvate tautomerase PptA (4-oxalocrotonate tautomerase family)